MKNARLLRDKKSFILLLFIACFSAVYRLVLVLREGFPPGADIGLHDSLIHSITQGGSTNFMWNYYHMGGGNSNTFPGYHIFVSFVIFFTSLPDYLAEVLVAVLFSSLIVLVAFLITRKVLNASIGLIVAFLVGISYYDIYILLWSGYPNVITLMLIPLIFYVLLEKSRFPRLPRLTVASLLSAAIFLTHSLSAVMFVMLMFALVFVALCFPRITGIDRKDILDWLVPIFIGGLAVSPFLVQAAPFYLNLNSPVYTGGLPDVQQLLVPIRLVPFEFVLPFFVGFFLFFVFFKFVRVKLQFAKTLLVCWLIIPTVLTQSYIVGVYTDYERFLYFAALPLIVLVGIGIFLSARLLTKATNWLLMAGGSFLQKKLPQKKVLRNFISSSNQILLVLFAAILMLVSFFVSPHIFLSAFQGFKMQGQLQVMTKPGYDAMQWIKNYTPTNSVFVSDALYGWWLGGFAQRPTVSAVEPVFLTNSREFEPALLATRLLDTDYLVDNGLIQIREDGGYTANRSPEFLAKLSNSYYPFPFLNFNCSQTTITFRTNGDLDSVMLSKLPVREMYIENFSTYATICNTWGNEFLNFTQIATVYQGERFVNMTQALSSINPTINFVSVNFTLQTRGNIVAENDTFIALEDPYTNVAGQLIFGETQPNVTQVSESSIEIFFNLKTQSKADVNFYVTVFEYPILSSTSATQSNLYELFINNTKSYAEKVAEFPLDVFDYRQAIANMSVSYIVIRDYSQITRFAKDPLFSRVFVNEEVTIFQIHKLDQLHSNTYK
jgi:hypothetical protein